MNLKRAIGGPLLAIVFVLFFTYMISGLVWIFQNYSQTQGSAQLTADVSLGAQDVTQRNVPQNNNLPVVQLEVDARAAISVESSLSGADRIIFEKYSNVRLPIASLAKLMTAVVVLDNYNLIDNIVVDKIADAQDPMKQDIKFGDTLSVEKLLDIMLIESSNKSAYALSEGPGGIPGEQKFVDLMNKKAKEVGMENTFFADPTGLNSFDVSSASDLVKLAEYILANKGYSKILETSKMADLNVPGLGDIKNTDELLAEIPDIVCSKTGFTTAANGCLLLVVNNPNGGYLINVILGADDRFSEMKKLINWSSAICN